jgi:hypothetical protein
VKKVSTKFLRALPFKIGVAIDAANNLTRIDIYHPKTKALNVVFSGTTGTYYVYAPKSANPTKCVLQAQSAVTADLATYVNYVQTISQETSDFSLTNSSIRAAFNTADTKTYDVYKNNIKKNYAVAKIYFSTATTALNYYIDATIYQALEDMIPLIPNGKNQINLVDLIPT